MTWMVGTLLSCHSVTYQLTDSAPREGYNIGNRGSDLACTPCCCALLVCLWTLPGPAGAGLRVAATCAHVNV